MKLKILPILAAMVLALGCKPKIISGQMFISSDDGISIPVGGVQINLIASKEVASYLNQREETVNIEIEEVLKQIAEAKQKQSEAHTDYAEALHSYNDYVDNRRYTTNVEYLKLKQSQDSALQRAEYNSRPSIPSSIPRGNQQFDRTGTISVMQANLSHLVSELETPMKSKLYQANIKKDESDNLLNILAGKKSQLQTSQHFFEGFSPSILSSTTTDMDGSFVIHWSRTENFLFSKYEHNGSQPIFWLVSLRKNEGKIILSNHNSFSPHLNSIAAE